jgi:hypothetical protein
MSGTTTGSAKCEAELVIRAQHTPTPWSISDLKTIEGDSMVCAGEGHGYGLVASVTIPQDAAFIVRAVNAHDDLVKALEKAQRALAMIVAPEAIKATSAIHAFAQAFEAEVSARAALSKAGGGQ